MKKDELDIFARTIYGEARGEYENFEGGISAAIPAEKTYKFLFLNIFFQIYLRKK